MAHSHSQSYTHTVEQGIEDLKLNTNTGNLHAISVQESDDNKSNAIVVDYFQGVNQGEDLRSPIEEQLEKMKDEPIEKLKITRIANLLNSSPHPYDVKTVAMMCGLTRQQLIQLDANAAGGGDIVGSFLDALVIKHSELPSQDLKVCFTENNMKKSEKVLASLLKGNPNIKKIGDLSPEDLAKLAPTLNVPIGVSLPNWETVAEDFEMQESIPTIRSAVRENNQFCRTTYLMNILKVDCCKIRRFHDALVEIGNNVVLKEVESQLHTMAKQTFRAS